MASANRRTIWLAGIAVAIAVAAVVWSGSGPTPAAGPSPPPRAPAPRSQPNAQVPQSGPPQINLVALQSTRERPGESERNPFRFQARPLPPVTTLPPPTATNQSLGQPMMPSTPPGPPPPPPIPLKFIGLVTQGNKRVAVLSDGKSSPMHGEEGGTILGQYRILKIGNESLEMAYIDGRGRQTIRLTGQ
jgi:hypothetical protein